MFQAYNLIPVLSARENIEFILQLQGVARKDLRALAEGALASVGLAGLGDRHGRRRWPTVADRQDDPIVAEDRNGKSETRPG